MCSPECYRSVSVKCLAQFCSCSAGLPSQDGSASENLCELLRLNEHEVHVNTEGENVMGTVMHNATLLPLISSESTKALKTTTDKCVFHFFDPILQHLGRGLDFSFLFSYFNCLTGDVSVQFSSACLHLLLNAGKYLTLISSKQPTCIKKNVKPLNSIVLALPLLHGQRLQLRAVLKSNWTRATRRLHHLLDIIFLVLLQV